MGVNGGSLGPGRSVSVYLVDRLELQGLLRDLGWDQADDSWVLEGRGWRATMPGPVPLEGADVPEVVSQRQVGIGWRIEARLEGARLA